MALDFGEDLFVIRSASGNQQNGSVGVCRFQQLVESLLNRLNQRVKGDKNNAGQISQIRWKLWDRCWLCMVAWHFDGISG